jgi:murein DD-endopeptidase MepM/ murein hydrolase activator NlpD
MMKFGVSLRTRALLLALAVLLPFTGSFPAHAANEPTRMVEMTTWDGDGLIHFTVHNLAAGNVTTTVDLKSSNLKGSTNFPCTAVIPGNETVELFTLNRGKKNSTPDYHYTYAATLGSSEAVHDDSQVYLLPYAPEASFRVSQGYHGHFSHTGPDEYAIDWEMPEGTPVFAARGGLVVKSKDDSSEGGPDRKYLNAANCVLIQHDDGTIGMYGHLLKDGNTVQAGDQVEAGDQLGLSGNTGFSAGPHLHFSVFTVKNGRERLSLSVKFRTADQDEVVLEMGQVYQAAGIAEPLAPLESGN